MSSNPAPSSLRINPDLVKKIKSILEASPNNKIDEDKIIDLLQNDSSVRLKK
jgi:hypothetical protein